MKKCICVGMIFLAQMMWGVEYIEKPIVVVVPSFNNKDWYVKNLDSIFSQRYSNFKVIYIDDCSDDGTASLVEDYVNYYGYQDKCTIVKNQTRYGPLYNRFSAVHSCPDDVIVVLVDGDDWLAHDGVLAYLNELYSSKPIYMTVGNACKSSTGMKIGYRDYTQNEWETFGIRSLGFRGVHPRTFYAWLFKKIKVEDLFEGERFYPMATDVACLLPMFEMAQGHYHYIQDILYVYNNENPLNMARNGFQSQIYCDMMIRNRPAYEQLTSEQVGSSITDQKVELSGIVFAEKQRDSYAFIEACNTHERMFDEMVVIGAQDFKSDVFSSIAQSLQFLSLGCDLQTIYTLRVNIRDRIKAAVTKMKSKYVVIMADECLDRSDINFDMLCAALENTQAHAMVLGNNPSESVASYYTYYTDDTSTVYLARPWMFSQSFNSKNGCFGLIMHKDMLLAMLESATVFYPNFYTVLASWHSLIPKGSVLLMSFFNN